MKVSWNKLPTKVITELLQDVKATAPKLVEAFSKEVEVSARRNFNRAIPDISGDNPYVSVVRTVSGLNAKITCYGEQVLYAEFGAGLLNKYYDTVSWVKEHEAISSSGATYIVQGHWRKVGYNARGFKDMGETEIMPRPEGIGALGHNPEAWHTPSWGINGFWFRKTENGRTGSMETLKKKRNGEIDDRYVWTMGTKPVRGLYRARNTAINKLQSGRLNIK